MAVVIDDLTNLSGQFLRGPTRAPVSQREIDRTLLNFGRSQSGASEFCLRFQTYSIMKRRRHKSDRDLKSKQTFGLVSSP